MRIHAIPPNLNQQGSPVHRQGWDPSLASHHKRLSGGLFLLHGNQGPILAIYRRALVSFTFFLSTESEPSGDRVYRAYARDVTCCTQSGRKTEWQC